MTDTPIQRLLTKLVETAKAATKGPWGLETGFGDEDGSPYSYSEASPICIMGTPPCSAGDATHIVLSDPEMIVGLADMIDTLCDCVPSEMVTEMSRKAVRLMGETEADGCVWREDPDVPAPLITTRTKIEDGCGHLVIRGEYKYGCHPGWPDLRNAKMAAEDFWTINPLDHLPPEVGGTCLLNDILIQTDTENQKVTATRTYDVHITDDSFFTMGEAEPGEEPT